ncbi:MAG: tyrosine-type recombinase/integrase [Campylobacter sp.]|uniref:tyrosine-type recombinase/integrase n=1 Tax=Campylobacter sp. TaxID=205 RepID=UPI002AA90442|nr:tyrosine-type recombinase/integrase [Campylobacter sp.]MCI6344469.1 tyrosine-type recombinase/integrase [Campylobacter sp.]MCI7463221.1 tyrosine-type recombinase/integrase [Campylobacter sp.]
MANTAKQSLIDKDIRALVSKELKYKKVVGNPKELYIWVNPNGTKSFTLRYNNKFIKIKEFREGIYSVADARRDALKMLKELENGKDIEMIKGAGGKYIFKNLFELYIEQKRKNGLQESTLAKTKSRFERFLLPSLGLKDAKTIKYSDLLDICNAIFNPSCPNQSRLETLHRMINDLHGIFNIAIKDRYIDYYPSFGLNKEFPTTAKFNLKNQIDTRLNAITDESVLKSFLRDLKENNTLDSNTKRALYLQILCVNRPINTASAKWADIDLQNGIWTIQGSEMKMNYAHKIALCSQAIRILQAQKLFSGDKIFVFPAANKDGHLNRDTISKAVRNLGGKNKYNGVATSHGFRATFRTICSLHKAELLKLGISDEAIESALAHKERDQVKFAYERETATLAQKRILMQWYADFLESIEPLGV